MRAAGRRRLCKQAVNGRYPFDPASSRRNPDRRFRPAVRAGRADRRVFQHAAAPLCRCQRQRVEGTTARRRGGADRAGRTGAVPARRRDPRSVFRRRRQRAVAAFRLDPRLSRSRHQAGHARTRRHHRHLCSGSAEGDADHVAGLRDEHRPAGVRPAAESRRAGFSGNRTLGALPPVRTGQSAAGRARPNAIS